MQTCWISGHYILLNLHARFAWEVEQEMFSPEQHTGARDLCFSTYHIQTDRNTSQLYRSNLSDLRSRLLLGRVWLTRKIQINSPRWKLMEVSRIQRRVMNLYTPNSGIAHRWTLWVPNYETHSPNEREKSISSENSPLSTRNANREVELPK